MFLKQNVFKKMVGKGTLEAKKSMTVEIVVVAQTWVVTVEIVCLLFCFVVFLKAIFKVSLLMVPG